MSDENKDHELSLEDIFSRIRKEDESGGKETTVPFKFLDSYTREDKNIFFGRDNETEELFRKMYSGKLLLVYGKSGTGKSSIVNCGLISRIPQEDIFAISIRCGQYGYDNFVTEIRKHSKTEFENPLEILEDIFYSHSKPVALIFDQFEEIFILSEEEERLKLADALNQILRSRLKINIILIIREEYLASLTEFESFIPGLFSNRTRIERISTSAAKEAIVKPCIACNVQIEEGISDRIIEQLVWQSEGLELTWLQILMDKLYRTAAERDPGNPHIRLEDLNRLGRIGNVLSDFVDEQLNMMPHGDMGEAVLKTMISVDGTKKLVNITDITDTLKTTGKETDQPFIEEILRHLVNIRIITDKNDQGYYEVRHDAIADRIYERMTAVEKELIEVKTFLDNSYKIYEQRQVLLNDNDLKYIALYENRLVLNEKIKGFIKTSKKEVHRARQNRRTVTVAATIALLMILSGFTLWAMIERSKAVKQNVIAEEQKNEALKANREAEKARTQALEDKNKAVESEAVAINQQKIAEGQSRIAQIANWEAENSRKQALDERNRAVANERLALAAKQDAENAKNEVIKAGIQTRFYMYLFNGKELSNKSLLLQENDTLRALLALSAFDLVTYGYQNFSTGKTDLKYENEILEAMQKAYLSFEPNSVAQGEIWSVTSIGNQTLFSNKAGVLNITEFDDSNPDKLPVIKMLGQVNLPTNSMVRSLASDPGSDRLACGTLDGNVVLLGKTGSPQPEQSVIYNHNKKRVLFISFVPEKNWLISTATDTTILVWDLARQETVRKLRLNDPVQKFVIANSDQLIYSNSGGTLFRWNLNELNSEPEIIYKNKAGVTYQCLAWNNSLGWLAAASSGTIHIFRFNPGNQGTIRPEQFTLRHKGVISRMEFSPDNNWLLTASPDAIMLWNLKDVAATDIDKFVPLVIENSNQVFSISFVRDSRYFLYGDNEQLHIYPIDINDIYSRLKMKTGRKDLSEKEWKYYVKGDLERPELK